jgi:hypothetical protein
MEHAVREAHGARLGVPCPAEYDGAAMTFDELLQRIATEPNRTSERDVRIPSAELMSEIHAAGGIRVDVLMADTRHTVERRGIHLWADLDKGRAYQGLAPLGEWRLARRKTWGEDADPALLADRYLALSYHADSAAFVVLDTDSGRYFLMDACGADETSPIGWNVGELLDWLWDNRIP